MCEIFKICFNGRETWRKIEQKAEIERKKNLPFASPFHKHPRWPLSGAESKSQELNPSLPHGWQGHKYLSHHLLSSVCLSSKLGSGSSQSSDLNLGTWKWVADVPTSGLMDAPSTLPRGKCQPLPKCISPSSNQNIPLCSIFITSLFFVSLMEFNDFPWYVGKHPILVFG